MDHEVMRKFVQIFCGGDDWDKSHKLARQAGLMVFLHPRKDEDCITGVKWDPESFIRQSSYEGIGIAFEGNHPIAWRRDFVERIVSLGYVPSLEGMSSLTPKS